MDLRRLTIAFALCGIGSAQAAQTTAPLPQAKALVARLKQTYPGRQVFSNHPSHPTEVIVETAPSAQHEKWSEAIAVIAKTAAHRHERSTETYHVQSGSLLVKVDGKARMLRTGDSLVIKPGQVHSARAIGGKPAVVKARSEPGWRFDDQFPVE